MSVPPFQSAVGAPLGRVTLAGYNRNSRGMDSDRMRIYGSFALVYCLAGEACYKDVLGYQTDIHPGDLILVFPDLGHNYRTRPGRTWDEFFVCFEGPVFEIWQKTGLLDPHHPTYHLEPLDYWLRRFEEIVTPHLLPLERVCRAQSALADALINDHRNAAAECNEEWLAQARTLLEADPEKTLYAETVARRLGISHETFRKKFVRLAGVSPYRHRLIRLMDHACQLVREGRLTNKEIADRLGFSDEFYFSRRFKQIIGRSPTQFRALLQPHQ